MSRKLNGNQHFLFRRVVYSIISTRTLESPGITQSYFYIYIYYNIRMNDDDKPTRGSSVNESSHWLATDIAQLVLFPSIRTTHASQGPIAVKRPINRFVLFFFNLFLFRLLVVFPATRHIRIDWFFSPALFHTLIIFNNL